MAGRIRGSADGLITRLEQWRGQAVKDVNDGMHEAMLAVQQEAIARAPVEHGDLERAIKIANAGLRRAWIVYVDEAMPDDTGKYTVGDYAMWLHESTYNLGPLSLQKAAANGKPVGRKYLQGAFDDMKDKILRSLRAKLAARLKQRGY